MKARLKKENEIGSSKRRGLIARTWIRDYQLYLMMIPIVIYLFIFAYLPLYGVQIAFKDYRLGNTIWDARWVGFDNFKRFFTSFQFGNILTNTITLSLYGLIAGFPLPIILALLVSQVQHKRYKKFVQTITYAPHFISVVVIVGMLFIFLSPRNGVLNIFRAKLGLEAINFMAFPKYFKHLYVWSGIWQSAGWSSIIYIAALSSVSPELYEAADIDGATRIQRIRHIDFPTIVPTITILLILNVGSIMNQGAQKAYLMQTGTTSSAEEIIATYVYKVGLIQTQFSYSSAIGLFNNIINVILLVTVNAISRKVSETSLW